jgi:ketosteroid isomerase-like protein
MKRCPTCNRTYTDETLRFCLEDGAALVRDVEGFVPDPEATVVREASHGPRDVLGPPPTELLGQRGAKTIAVANSGLTAPTARPTETYGERERAPVPKPRSTAMVVIVSVVCTILLLSLGALGVFLYLKNRGDAEQARAGNTEVNRPANNANTQSSGNNTQSNTQNNAQNGNRTNVNGNSRSTPTPAPSPTAAPVDVAAVAGQVTSALNGWAAATTARDINAHMNYYADTLDTYYNAKNVGSSRVRTDRARAFNTYSSMDVQLSNIRVTPDPSGQRATATFDKTWTFEGDKYSNGSVQQLVTLAKTGGRWRITGEKDLQVYYVNH